MRLEEVEFDRPAVPSPKAVAEPKPRRVSRRHVVGMAVAALAILGAVAAPKLIQVSPPDELVLSGDETKPAIAGAKKELKSTLSLTHNSEKPHVVGTRGVARRRRLKEKSKTAVINDSCLPMTLDTDFDVVLGEDVGDQWGGEYLYRIGGFYPCYFTVSKPISMFELRVLLYDRGGRHMGTISYESVQNHWPGKRVPIQGVIKGNVSTEEARHFSWAVAYVASLKVMSGGTLHADTDSVLTAIKREVSPLASRADFKPTHVVR